MKRGYAFGLVPCGWLSLGWDKFDDWLSEKFKKKQTG